MGSNLLLVKSSILKETNEILERLPQQRYPLRLIQTINHYLYEDLGFRGNRSNYPEFLASVTPRQFLGRMLMNLKVIYFNEGKIEPELGVIERILLLFPDSVNEKRDRGILYYHLQRWREARQDLENYLEIQPTAQDAAIIRQILDQMSQNM